MWFYALTSSKDFGVREASYYNYLKNSQCYTANNIDDSQNY